MCLFLRSWACCIQHTGAAGSNHESCMGTPWRQCCVCIGIWEKKKKDQQEILWGVYLQFFLDHYYEGKHTSLRLQVQFPFNLCCLPGRSLLSNTRLPKLEQKKPVNVLRFFCDVLALTVLFSLPFQKERNSFKCKCWIYITRWGHPCWDGCLHTQRYAVVFPWDNITLTLINFL